MILDRATAPPKQLSIDDINIDFGPSQGFDNGCELHTIPWKQADIIRVDFVVPCGTLASQGDHSNLFMFKVLTEGTRSFTGNKIKDTVSFHGAYLDHTYGRDNSIISLYCLPKSFHDLFIIVQSIIEELQCSPEDLDRIKRISKSDLSRNQEKTSYLATQELKKRYFGPSHPYGLTYDEEAIDGIQLDDINKASERLANGPVKVYLAGNFNNAIAAAIEKYLLNKKTEASKLNGTSFLESTSREIVHVKKQSEQSSIRLTLKAPAANHKDHFNFKILNELFGGFFGSRLMKNIREDKGYTYGIYSGYSHSLSGSYINVSCDVNSDSVNDTFAQIEKEIHLLNSVEVSFGELEVLKNFTYGSIQSSLCTPYDLLSKLQYIHKYKLDLDYYNQYICALREITPESIKNTAHKFLDFERSLKVYAG